jgi:hypothetical protein
MVEAVSTSDMPVNFNETAWCNIPEGSYFDTSRRENVKPYYT